MPEAAGAPIRGGMVGGRVALTQQTSCGDPLCAEVCAAEG